MNPELEQLRSDLAHARAAGASYRHQRDQAHARIVELVQESRACVLAMAHSTLTLDQATELIQGFSELKKALRALVEQHYDCDYICSGCSLIAELKNLL